MNDRKKEIMRIVGDKSLEPTVDEFLFLEKQLLALKELPFIKFDPARPERQKTTPAAKLYKELLQQYINVFKVLWRISNADDVEVESPLRRWLNANIEKDSMDS